MTTEEQGITLTAEQATEQVQAWIAAGLPAGVVYVRENAREIAVTVATHDDVDLWATAAGVDAHRSRRSYGTPPGLRPVDLPGWGLDVYTNCPPVAHSGVRIALLGAVSV